MRKLESVAILGAMFLALPTGALAQDAFNESPLARTGQGSLVRTIATAEADAAGEGVVGFEVDRTSSPDFVAQELRQTIQLSSGAVPQSITVQEGFAEVGFSDAVPFATVEATMPTEIAASIGATGGDVRAAAEPEWVVVGEAVAQPASSGGRIGEFSDEGW